MNEAVNDPSILCQEGSTMFPKIVAALCNVNWTKVQKELGIAVVSSIRNETSLLHHSHCINYFLFIQRYIINICNLCTLFKKILYIIKWTKTKFINWCFVCSFPIHPLQLQISILSL